MPYKYVKKRCRGCGRTIAHTHPYGTPRWHLCPHGQVCVFAYGLLGGADPPRGGHPRAPRDPRYRACAECAERWGWGKPGRSA
jgi:hypothetical protein